MKRMAFSIVLAVFAVAVCIFGYCNTARSANKLIVSAENIDRLLSDGEAEKALEESRKLQADWEKYTINCAFSCRTSIWSRWKTFLPCCPIILSRRRCP